LNPAGITDQLLLHSANASLLFLVLQRLTGARGAAAGGGFVACTRCMSSPCMVAERKDVLSAFFSADTVGIHPLRGEVSNQ